MDADRQSFIIYKNFYEPIKHLDDVDLGKLFRAIFEYNLTGDGKDKLNGYAVPPEVKIPFEFFRNQFNLDEAKWLKRVEASRENGLKGGRPPQPKEPTGLSRLETEPRKGDTVTVTVTGTGTETENETEKDLKEIQKKSFDVWWIYWKSLIWKHEGKKQKAWEYYQQLKFMPEQITEATRKYLESKRAVNQYHMAAEGFLNPKGKQVKYYLEYQTPPKPSIESDRSAPIEISWKNQIHTVKQLLHGKNKQQAQEEWMKIPKTWRDYDKIQQLFQNKY
jgi:hypothetical protein